MHLSHRKQVRHPVHSGAVRSLTFSCYQRRPLLQEDWTSQLLAEAIENAMARHQCRLLAFVFMPEHVHLLTLPTVPDASISALLKAIKQPHAFRVKQRLQATGDARLNTLKVQERPGLVRFRFWQEGSGYDRSIFNPPYLQTTIEYLHANPVRRGLCDHPRAWHWSSWHHHHGGATAGLPTVRGVPKSLAFEP